MIPDSLDVAILDTNVIYPLISRDLLFWFAHYDFFQPKWTRDIFQEWEAVMMRKGIAPAAVQKRTQQAQLGFPDALVKGHERFIPLLTLPDEHDRHILAAAIKARAGIIVTNNLRDFPLPYLEQFNIIPMNPDAFMSDLIARFPEQSLAAFMDMASQRKNPPVTFDLLFAQMQKIGLVQTARNLKRLVA